MMYTEFLNLAKVTEDDITAETYDNIIEPMYMATDMNKYEFVEMLNIKAICDKYTNVNKVCRELVKLIAEMKSLLGHTTMHEQENKFVELAKQFCELRGMEYCYEDPLSLIYEIPLYERGCTMYTGFVAKMGKDYYTYTIDKTVEVSKYCAA